MAENSRGLAAMLGLQKRRKSLPSLGTRELAVMEVLWGTESETTAQQVLDNMPAGTIGLSTIQSTLERLYRKKLVSRHKLGRAYAYAARCRRQDLISQLLQDITRDIAGGDMQPVISGFISYLEDAPGDTDDTLEVALRRHRQSASDD